MLTVTAARRRRLIARRHRLAGGAPDIRDAASALYAVHATDPATPALSMLARSSSSTLADVATELYERRTLLRWLCMRRTLFVLARDDVPAVHAAVGIPLADRMRRALVARIAANGTEPPVEGDAAAWLADAEDEAQAALRDLGTASGQQLAAAAPRLGTAILARTASQTRQNVTTSLLAVLSAEGRIVRSVPQGAWTSRQHRWQGVEEWFPGGIPALDPVVARDEVAARYLAAYGPATVEDLAWWTGWGLTASRAALAANRAEEVDLEGETGWTTAADSLGAELAEAADAPPTAAVLPALDSTAMGWTRRAWFLAVDPADVVDRSGNIGPTVWWDGEVVGSWAVGQGGDVRVAITVDRGRGAAEAVQAAAARLTPRLEGAVVRPSFPTRLERSLR